MHPQHRALHDISSAHQSVIAEPYPQSGYLQQARLPRSAQPAVLAASVQHASPIRQLSSGHMSEAALHSGLSDSPGASPPTYKRIRASKTIRVENGRQLAGVEAVDLVSPLAVPGLSMMTVPERSCSSHAAKRARRELAPLQGLDAIASPRSSTEGIRRSAHPAAQWPSAANDMLQHGQPPLGSPSFSGAASQSYSNQHAPGRQHLDTWQAANRPVSSIANPFGHITPGLPQGVIPGQDMYRSLAQAAGVGYADTEDDAIHLLQQLEMSKQDSQFSDQQTQHPHRVTELFASRSGDSIQAAEDTGAQYVDQLQQHRRSAQTDAQVPDANAIDLCEDDAMLSPEDAAGRQAQIEHDEKMAQELDRSENRQDLQRLSVRPPFTHFHQHSHGCHAAMFSLMSKCQSVEPVTHKNGVPSTHPA